MKYILLFFFLSFICCKGKNQSSKVIKENLNIDSLSMVAIGDAKFGMDSYELRKTDALKDASYSHDYITFDFEINNEIFSGSAKLSEDTLHTISFYSEREVAAQLYDYLNPYGEKLKKYFEKEYGEPDYSNYPLAYEELIESEITPMFIWEIGNKKIEIGIFRNFPYYVTICSITNPKYKKNKW